MQARAFILTLPILILATGQLAWPQGLNKVARIGFFGIGSPSATKPLSGAFRQGLHELGYTEGQNILVEYRYADGHEDRVGSLITELVRLNVDVLVVGSRSGQWAAKKATTSIPIVMPQSGDPVGQGLIASLARPGGNITGLTTITEELSGKRLELFKETIPRISSVAFLWGGSGPGPFAQAESAARPLGIRVQRVVVSRAEDLDNAFRAITHERANALLVGRGPIIRTTAARIRDFADKRQLPTMYDDKLFVASGGLMSYGSDILDLYRRSATYVDKILKGAKPAELPVEQPRKFEFIINLKAAKRIGVTIPPNVLARADRVIQ
jgi:putative tryptophan/tyrosine transport system substrate-binding protein